ncbi:HET-domain-containing protein [Bimuria novae-zelandiae CBS 107.79]|uniref:HET-domain-containing protein n=1 Tax=Bimuria novae-zelandiae CBS 107.79 TaxID=1447943 RepID=A0A6A5VRH1_9PLEO|nr:HET-domain-containing protein [Bimuria novae-zelandiae CBS 107.79]
MRLLLRSHTGEFNLTKEFVGDDIIPPYAILSHTRREGEEIRFCGEQAERDGLQYFWVDTCCIDKSNYGELREALNSMFRWYRDAGKCYVYLSDVSTAKRKASDEDSEFAWEPAFRVSRWFTRGWTLQEPLAPGSVEFFSQEGKELGDKRLLTQRICKITGIPESALRGAPLSQFSINKRLSWIENRQTTLEEDKAYSLLGILDVYIPPLYGEGKVGAFKRLMDEIDKREKCIQDLHLTDPRDDKKRIEETKGDLLEDSYHWIPENSDFQRWRDDPQSRLLWIKGDSGKGKTMLLCGIINELNKLMIKTDHLSYFFCQATDTRINNATAVLRGLLYLLHDHAGKALFEDTNAWVVLSEIFTDILQDPSLNNTSLVIDALDECVTDSSNLSDFIVQKSCVSSRVKWIVSSRNWPDTEERLERAGHKVRLCIELNAESVSTAVTIFIRHKVLRLAEEKKYDEKTRNAVLGYLSTNANDTFLWVALVCQNLENIPHRKIFAKLNASLQADTGSIAIVYRPITLKELTSLVEMLKDIPDDLESLRKIIGLCGSFLTIRGDSVYFVHQSAKDFLFASALNEIFPSGTEKAHYEIFSRSLQVMSKPLRRDIYGLRAFGYPAEQVKQPDPDPLAASRYSCIYWIDHLCDWNPSSSAKYKVDLQDRGAVDSFLRQQYLYWLETLSLCKSMSQGVVSMAKLEVFMQRRTDASALNELVRDARRFFMFHKWAIENSPLQAYASALLFSPTQSLIKGLFKRKEPNWITIKPAIASARAEKVR